MDENELRALVAHYQQKHADATLEAAQYKVKYESEAAKASALQSRVAELEADAPAPLTAE